MSAPSLVPCPACGGSGRLFFAGCIECRGSGKVTPKEAERIMAWVHAYVFENPAVAP